jgi:hypothetical protein
LSEATIKIKIYVIFLIYRERKRGGKERILNVRMLQFINKFRTSLVMSELKMLSDVNIIHVASLQVVIGVTEIIRMLRATYSVVSFVLRKESSF